MARVEALLTSLRAHTKAEFDFLVSDYGSEAPCAEELVAASERLSFRVVRSEAQGLAWSRARAINTGVRPVLSPLTAVVDVDMVFHDGVIDHLVATIGDQDVYFLESLWPQRPRANPLRGNVNRSYGVFHMLKTSWFHRLSGFCENIQYWGGEDNDWVRRLTNAGAQVHWLTTDQFKLTHTWHPFENNPVTRPYTSIADTLRFEMANLITPYHNDQWGQPITRSDRPILGALDQVRSIEFGLGSGLLTPHVPRVLEALRSGALVRILFGERIPRRKLTALAPKVLGLQNWFGPFSLRLEYNVSGQLEEALTLISLLGGQAKVDYCFQDSTQSVYLLLRQEAVHG